MPVHNADIAQIFEEINKINNRGQTTILSLKSQVEV